MVAFHFHGGHLVTSGPVLVIRLSIVAEPIGTGGKFFSKFWSFGLQRVSSFIWNNSVLLYKKRIYGIFLDGFLCTPVFWISYLNTRFVKYLQWVIVLQTFIIDRTSRTPHGCALLYLSAFPLSALWQGGVLRDMGFSLHGEKLFQ